MKLYYAPGTCALAPHIVATEAGLKLDLVKVDLKSKMTDAGQDFLATNPNGYVPALVLDDGQTLTEAQLIVQFLADQKPESGLMPPAGAVERYRVQQWLAFIATELHKSFAALFAPDLPEQTVAAYHERIGKRLPHVEQQLSGQSFLFGADFSAADAYLWTILGWSKYINVDLTGHPNILKFMETVAARPAVEDTLAVEAAA